MAIQVYRVDTGEDAGLWAQVPRDCSDKERRVALEVMAGKARLIERETGVKLPMRFVEEGSRQEAYLIGIAFLGVRKDEVQTVDYGHRLADLQSNWNASADEEASLIQRSNEANNANVNRR